MKSKTLMAELTNLLNKYCEENKSNTPDFVLAAFLRNSLTAFNTAVNLRDKFWGFHPWGEKSDNDKKMESRLF